MDFYILFMDSLIMGKSVVGRMAGKVVANRPTASFEFELVEEDPDQLRTVIGITKPD